MTSSKVVNRNIIYYFLRNQNKNFKGRPNGNYRAFVKQNDITKTQTNIIKVKYITSVGDTSFTIDKYIESLMAVQNTIEKYFDLVGKTKFIDSDQTRKLYIPQTNNKKDIIINFTYNNISKSGKEQNEGQKYESEIIAKLNKAGYTTQTKAEELHDNQDVTITVGGKEVGIELKSNWKAAFGQARLEFDGTKWKLKDSASDTIKQMVKDANLLDWINTKWKIPSGYVPPKKPKKYDQEQLGGGTGHYIGVKSDYIINYYKDVDYIHIRDKGFYSMHSENPLKLQQSKYTKFSPSTAKARIRVKYIKSGEYAYVIELYLNRLTDSTNKKGLDGDLSFLGEP